MRQLMLGLAVLAVASGADGKSVQCAPVDEATIRAQFDRVNAAWATRDPAKVEALFAPDAVLLPTLSAEERTTPAAIHAYFVDFLKKAPVGQIDTSTVRIGCNMAARMGNWSITLTDPKTGEKSVAKARYTFIYIYERGHWMIAHLHSSLRPGG